MVVGHEGAPGLNAQARGHVHKDRQGGPGDGNNPGSPSTTLPVFATLAPSTSSPPALLSITLARSPDVVFPLSLPLPLATSTTALSAANPTSLLSSTESTSPSSTSSDTSLPINTSAISENGAMSTSTPNVGAIAGGIAGGVFLLALLAFLAVKYFRHRASLEAAHHKAPSAEFLDPSARELYRPPILAGYTRQRVASDSETLYSGKDSHAPFPSVVRFENPAYRDSVDSGSLQYHRRGSYYAALDRDQPKYFLVV